MHVDGLSLVGLLPSLKDAATYRGLVERIRNGRAAPDQHLLRAARPFVIAALAQDLGRTTLVVTGSVERAYNIAEQLPVWMPGRTILRFAEPSSIFYERSPWAANTISARLKVLGSLCLPVGATKDAAELPPVIVASALALMPRTLPVREFKANSRVIKRGQTVEPDKLLRQWLQIGYTPATVVVEPGTFSRRGGIIDIFPIQLARPVRIEFWGDEIESMRTFDPATQRSAETLDRVSIIPAREALPKFGRTIAEKLAHWFALLPPSDQDVTSAQPDEQDLVSESAFPHLEFYLPLITQQPASLLDYLPKDGLVMVDDWGTLEETLGELETQAVQQREEKLSSGMIPAEYPLPYWTWDELRDQIVDRAPLHLGHPLGAESTIEALYTADPLAVGRLFTPGPRFGGQLKAFNDALKEMRSQAQTDATANSTSSTTSIVISNQAQRLAELWNDSSRAQSVHPISRIDAPPTASMAFVEGALAEGWSLKADHTTDHITEPPNTSIVAVNLLTDAEIFGWKRPEPRRHVSPRAVSPESLFADLAPGDIVVHVEYGIARFQGLSKRVLDGAEREYLVLHFAGTDTLYVPIPQADRITRYVGIEGQEPALSKLGGGEWGRAKESARIAAEETAKELLELYARRASVKGFAFGPDLPWQAELEASFPFIETPDQLKALREVKADMQRSTPMDRLLIGDVGYGKTEVALRAAFKAVMGGKQVAILVPTTVLAQQHYQTFSQRMAAFPVKIEMLSRFRTHKEQTTIVTATNAGNVDIVIGTHRLLGSDIHFKDLGLVIVDEEQRFGVTHKERLKKMRTEVDVLTMTATPIPRTLYMSLAGVRDMSTLQTPPEERLPVLTHVGPWDERLIRQAILRELDRDGQVYFVHNRVSTIDTMAQRLRDLVPEAKVVIGHGQMLEDELEQVMLEFTAGKYDVLLCTTIIESGLDIPNANTIIIDHADMFGLAQLYQLRGRVGRSLSRAYAYLFHPRAGHLNPDARARLETIAEQTELGAGMNIAMRDLEIRGTGDLLGLRQSGYINAIGFHLYTQMLGQAVQRLKAGKELNSEEILAKATNKTSTTAVGEPLPSMVIDLPSPAFIPVDFIPEMAMRLQLYRRLADITQLQMVDGLDAELVDRFGPLPLELQGLLYQVRVKIMAVAANVSGISFNETQVAIKLPYLATVDRAGLQRYVGNDCRVSRTAVWLPREPSNWQARLLDVLERLDLRSVERSV